MGRGGGAEMGRQEVERNGLEKNVWIHIQILDF